MSVVFMCWRTTCVLQKNKSISVPTENDKKTAITNNLTDYYGFRNSPYHNTTIMNYLVTGLMCSGKSTFLDTAKKYSFDTIKSDDIVSNLYNDESIVHEIQKYLDIEQNQDNLEETVKKLFFTSKKNREIIEAILHPAVHEIISNSLDISQNLMVELPPIINNYKLFQKYKSIYIQANREIRIDRFKKRNNNDSTYFDKINALQGDFKLIKDACDLVIHNDNDTDTLNKHFERGIIKK